MQVDLVQTRLVPGHAIRRPTSPGLHTSLGKGCVQHHIIRKRSLDQRLLDDAVALHLIHGPCRVQCAVESSIRTQSLRPKRLQQRVADGEDGAQALRTTRCGAPLPPSGVGLHVHLKFGSSAHLMREAINGNQWRERSRSVPRVEGGPDEGDNHRQSQAVRHAITLTVCDSSGGRA